MINSKCTGLILLGLLPKRGKKLFLICSTSEWFISLNSIENGMWTNLSGYRYVKYFGSFFKFKKLKKAITVDRTHKKIAKINLTFLWLSCLTISNIEIFWFQSIIPAKKNV